MVDSDNILTIQNLTHQIRHFIFFTILFLNNLAWSFSLALFLTILSKFLSHI